VEGDDVGGGDEHDRPTAAYRQVGQRLRIIRQHRQLSLADVETRSGHELKASAVSSYERAERAIPVNRLQRLAHFYQLPVEQLLAAVHDPVPPAPQVLPTRIAVDLAHLHSLTGPEIEKLARFLQMIETQRHDFNGRVITVRDSDTYAIASIIGCGTSNIVRHLADLGLCYHLNHPTRPLKHPNRIGPTITHVTIPAGRAPLTR